MAYVIAQPCIGVKDTACLAVCPVDCIHPMPDEADFDKHDQLFIDPDMCIDCGMCALECLVQAIFHDRELPPEWSSFLEKNASYFRKTAV